MDELKIKPGSPAELSIVGTCKMCTEHKIIRKAVLSEVLTTLAATEIPMTVMETIQRLTGYLSHQHKSHHIL